MKMKFLCHKKSQNTPICPVSYYCHCIKGLFSFRTLYAHHRSQLESLQVMCIILTPFLCFTSNQRIYLHFCSRQKTLKCKPFHEKKSLIHFCFTKISPFKYLKTSISRNILSRPFIYSYWKNLQNLELFSRNFFLDTRLWPQLQMMTRKKKKKL